MDIWSLHSQGSKNLCCVDNYCTVGMLEAVGIESNKVRVDVQDGRLVISRI